MPTKDRFFVDRIGKISPATQAAQARSGERYVVVTLAGGDAVRLDMNDKRSAIRLNILAALKKNDKAAYLKTGERSDVVTDLLIPMEVSVLKLTAIASGDVLVEFALSAAPHYIKPGNPDFSQMRTDLETAKKRGLAVLVTEGQDDHEIVHVALLDTPAKGIKGVKEKGKSRAKRGAPVSLARARELFDMVNGLSCAPDAASAPCITFMYPEDGCYARAHEMCRLMIAEGEDPGKIWIHKHWLHVETVNTPSCSVTWRYHVAPTLQVSSGGATAVYVIDPSMFAEPVHQDVWTFAQGDAGAKIYHSGPEVYYMDETGAAVLYDNSYTETNSDLAHFRIVLMNRAASASGPPPYSVCYKPDIFLRDNLADVGLQPTIGGGISRSPDINHFRDALADPQSTLGSAAAKERDDLFENIEFGQTNYLYVRLQNRGQESGQADIDVYWTRPSTLPTPSSWNLIGTLHSGPIAVGEFKIVGPLEWSTIPAVGHYCFVSVVDNAKDPAPNVAGISSADDFYRFVRQNNNVSWKNFDIQDLFAGSSKRIEFQIQGWPRKSYEGDLELDLRQLPGKTVAELRLLTRLTANASLVNLKKSGEAGSYTKYQMGVGFSALRKLSLKPSDNTEAILEVVLPDKVPNGAFELAVIQRVNGLEMGRITRRLVVGDHPYIGNRRSKEVHLASCQWAKKMSGKRKVAYQKVDDALRHGYNGCRYCLPEYDTDPR